LRCRAGPETGSPRRVAWGAAAGPKAPSRGNHGWTRINTDDFGRAGPNTVPQRPPFVPVGWFGTGGTRGNGKRAPNAPTPSTLAGDRTDFPSHPRHQRHPQSKFTIVGIAFGHTFDGIVRGRRTPATDGPYLSVSIRVHPWLPTSRSYSGAIPQDASVASEPRRVIRGKNPGRSKTPSAFGPQYYPRLQPRLHRTQGAWVFRMFRVFRGPKSVFFPFGNYSPPRLSHSSPASPAPSRIR